ncbi:FadR/GntR family transcriptional regulator [Tepidibacter aestuarii]|uniref:FadR/GntR family transcriptional regulator n=1 Tax=Tepidibacter aestuarii TaxID=2925782 RepID=UPI0020BF3AD7|nr:FadR/GntR family transcriptional regulator [Tepidibacter aestuarii]CAH2212096.1 GntR family transcriptional regulator, transcriptional repressor for pyruvate dehydrogenase complex [Tepidibacter aestuarii]
MIKPVSKTTLYEEVIKEIIRMIKEGQWLPGDKIPGELSLSESFNVSRNIIREALKSLELSGVVEAKPGRGTFLTLDSLKNIAMMDLLWSLKSDSSIIELMETRLIIEPQLAFLAAERANQDDIKILENILEKSINAVENKSYTVKMGHEFHMTLAEISKNKTLSKFLHSITNELNAQRFMYVNDYVDYKILSNEVIEHKKIFEYIKNGEGKKAQDCIYAHINNRIQLIKDDFSK